MNIQSTKVKVAVCAMINLATRHDRAPVNAETMAARQGISKSNMEQAIAKLRKAGLIKGSRGLGGGFKVESLDITIDEIIVAIAGPHPEIESEDEYEKIAWADICQHVSEAMQARTLRDYTL